MKLLKGRFDFTVVAFCLLSLSGCAVEALRLELKEDRIVSLVETDAGKPKKRLVKVTDFPRSPSSLKAPFYCPEFVNQEGPCIRSVQERTLIQVDRDFWLFDHDEATCTRLETTGLPGPFEKSWLLDTDRDAVAACRAVKDCQEIYLGRINAGRIEFAPEACILRESVEGELGTLKGMVLLGFYAPDPTGSPPVVLARISEDKYLGLGSALSGHPYARFTDVIAMTASAADLSRFNPAGPVWAESIDGGRLGAGRLFFAWEAGVAALARVILYRIMKTGAGLEAAEKGVLRNAGPGACIKRILAASYPGEEGAFVVFWQESSSGYFDCEDAVFFRGCRGGSLTEVFRHDWKQADMIGLTAVAGTLRLSALRKNGPSRSLVEYGVDFTGGGISLHPVFEVELEGYLRLHPFSAGGRMFYFARHPERDCILAVED